MAYPEGFVVDDLYTKADVWSGRIKPIFDAHGWTWRNEPDPPTVEEISYAIVSLVRQLEDGGHGPWVASGRLLVTVVPISDPSDIYVSIDMGRQSIDGPCLVAKP
jgi:hypothetical protein